MEFITKLKLEDKVVVTDPCYCYEPQRGIVLLNIQAGEYKCCVIYNKENRVKEAIILHESLSIYEQEGYLWLQDGFIYVDAAIAGVINYSLHEEMRRCKNRNEKNGKINIIEKYASYSPKIPMLYVLEKTLSLLVLDGVMEDMKFMLLRTIIKSLV